MARSQPGLLIGSGPAGQQPIRLDADVITLGRSDSCTIVAPLPTVSRLHARIELQHDRYMLFDADSANGTFLNGRRLSAGVQLSSGDEIWLGTAEAAFSFMDPEETLQVASADSPAPLTIDTRARAVSVYGIPAALSPLEYSLLSYLAANPGTVCTRESCFLAVWGQPYDQATCEDALNACVTRLRRSLRAAADAAQRDPLVIATIPRVGLRLDSAVVFAQRDEPPTPLRERSVGG
jgi:DNA-binding response OmpR family regulator